MAHDYHVRVLQGTSSLYVIDLSACYAYLSRLLRTLKAPKHVFRSFIDSELIKNDDWMTCIKDGETSADLIGLVVTWNNMPSRVTYKLVSKVDGSEAQLDPDNEDDEPRIHTAAQLSRIISRRLELTAYDNLQRILNNNSDITMSLLSNLARLLLTLRWRISWWKLLGFGTSPSSTAEQREKEKFADRVQSLCRILYFYYCCMVRRLPAHTDRSELKGRRNSYADTQRPVWEAFPHEESIAGFEAWMKEGEKKIQEAKVVEQLRRIGLS